MATDLATLRVNVVAATRDFERGMGKVQKDTKSATKSFRDMRGQILAVTAAAAGIGFLAKKTFDIGAAVEETASKYRTVFGPAVDETNKLLGKHARMMGMTDQAMQEVVATTGSIVQGMGFAKRESAEFSVEVSRLAADFASFNNVPIEDTSRAIQAALTGERESMKRLGVVILETDVQKRALAQTGKENAKQLTQQEKAMATLALITERAGVAVGDLERTQDSSANTYRRVSATVRQFRDDIATGLLPALGVFLGEIDASVGGLEQLGENFKSNSGAVVAWAKVIVASVKAFIAPFQAAIRIAFNFGQSITNVFQVMWKAIRGDIGGADEAFRALLANLGDIKDSALDVVGIYGELGEAAALAWEASERGARRVATTTQNAAAATRDVASATEAAAAAMDSAISGLAPKIAMVDSGAMRIAASMKEATNRTKTLAAAGQNVAMAFSDSLVSGLSGGKDAFKEFVDYALNQLLRLAAQMAVFKGLELLFAGSTGGIGATLGGLFKETFGGARAHGGPVQTGKSYLVGEQGPELFTPQQSGNITPNGASAMSFDFSTFPAPSNPLAMARDAEWMRFLTESLENAKSGGYSFQGAG